MKLGKTVAFGMIILALAACVPRVKVPVTPVPEPKPVPRKVETGEEIFKRAEDLFQKKAYAEAFSMYEAYLFRFPHGLLAAAALMKMGAIQTDLQNYAGARSAFKRILSDYPESPFKQDAMVAFVASFYQEKKFEDMIVQAHWALRQLVSRVHTLQTYVLLGDAYHCVGNYREAVFAYGTAHKIATQQEKETILFKFKNSVRRLAVSDLETLLARLEDKFSRSYLLYQLGLYKTGEEKFEEAYRILTQFVETYPQHEHVEIAQELLVELDNKLAYARNTIGCLLPLSGRFALFGQRALRGIELAFQCYHAQQDAKAFRVIIKDTQSLPEASARAVAELANERVAAIIGPIITAETAAREAQERSIPIITLTQKEKITASGDYVFRNFITPQMQVKTLVSYATEEMGLRRFAILYPHEKYGITFMNLFWDEVIAHRAKVVGAEAYNPKHTDFADPIKKIVGLYYPLPKELHYADEPGNTHLYSHDEEEPGERVIDEEIYYSDDPKAIVDFAAVFLPDSPKKAGLIIPQLAFYDIQDVLLLGTNLWHSKKMIEMAKDYIQGAIIAEGFFAESALTSVKDFVTRFEAIYAHKPGFIEAVCYDTIKLLFQLLKREDIRFRSTLREALKKIRDFEGVTGITSFDETGDVNKNLYLLRVKGDRFVEIRD